MLLKTLRAKCTDDEYRFYSVAFIVSTRVVVYSPLISNLYLIQMIKEHKHHAEWRDNAMVRINSVCPWRNRENIAPKRASGVNLICCYMRQKIEGMSIFDVLAKAPEATMVAP